MPYMIGIDIGTSGTKAAIFSEKGNLVSLEMKEYLYDIPEPGFAEQDPEVWWRAAAEIIGNAMGKAGIKKEEVVGVGLSGQMHGMVPLDKKRNVVRKAILHCDIRAAKTVEDLAGRIGRERFHDITYNPVFSGMQLVSLEWMRQHEPKHYEPTNTVVCPKDYVRYRLAGELGTEATDASGTLAYDMQKQAWSEELIEKLGLPASVFPATIRQPYDVAGTVSCEAAAKTGLAAGTPVVYGGGDQAMHSLGNGVLDKNVLMVTIGTSGQAILLTDRLIRNPEMNTHTFRHVCKDMWFGMGASLYAGAALNWFRRTFSRASSYEELSRLAETAPPCSRGLVFFPAMSGERTPYMDMNTRGAFLGMTMAHTKAHFVRAIMEGVTLQLRLGIGILEKLYGKPQKCICAGGGVKSGIWCRIQADIFGREIYVLDIPEQACLGAAIAAGVGIGLFRNMREGADAMCRAEQRIVEPDIDNAKKYDDFYSEIYKTIYPNNSDMFRKMWSY